MMEGAGARRAGEAKVFGDAPRAFLLSNGSFASLVSEAGGGRIQRGRLAITRWAPDRTRDADGVWLYVRDVESGEWWRAAPQPGGTHGKAHETRFRPGEVRLEREDGGITTRVEVCVATDADAELRRATFVNTTPRSRRLEITTYAELVLNDPAADIGHPAFSKLFVQTAHRRDAGALVAWRRLRSPEDEPLWAAHLLVAESGIVQGAELETDRMRFIGRGRTTSDPRAMDAGARLSGAIGNVLDPVFALRTTIEIAPHGETRLASVIAAAPDEGAVTLARRFATLAAVDAAFEAAARRGSALAADAGLAADWECTPAAIGELLYTGSPERATPAGEVPSGDREMLALAAPLVRAARGRLTHPDRTAVVTTPVAAGRVRGEPSPASARELLRFDNGFGGFADDGSEYVIRIGAGSSTTARPPLPWTNVIANESAGFIVSESGAGYTWSLNSRENRLTPWFNDPVSDPYGEALYVRDDATGEFWSPVPGPAPDDYPSEVRHGLGYTRFRRAHGTLEHDVWMFVPPRDAVKIVRVRLTNRGPSRRRLSAYAYAQWVLGSTPQQSGGMVHTSMDEESGAILAVNPGRGELAGRVAFAAAGAPPMAAVSRTADRAELLGRQGDPRAPAAVVRGGALGERFGAGTAVDPCAAFRVGLELEAGDSVELVFLLGEADSREAARELVRRHAGAESAAHALDETRAFWRALTGRLQIETPDPTLDLMVNHWLPYQNLGCRMRGRSAFYQSGGAYGFRDQLQDSSAFLYLDPLLTRRQIVLHAAHQFVEGDVLHWWHPPLDRGMRTRFADDLLWLPYVTTSYIGATGDAAVLDELAPFLHARLLEPGEDEAFLVPELSSHSGTVYEHCCRAIDRSLTRGAHGLPLIGVGDWNDGMNRVGREGRGESVWLGFFLYDILGSFIPVCESRGDDERASRYRSYRLELGRALNADGAGWDGQWYRRAYYDDGTPLGSASSDECRIDVIAQAWAVLSGAAPAERAAQALEQMERHLVSERDGIIRLLTPAFDRTPHDPGYIKGYLPGVRENGGQYTHGALWAVRALAEDGRCERAAPLLSMLSPVSHARTPDEVAVYQAEPYVIAADVYGVAPHVGRGGWTWYTGSAGWMYRVALESVLGFELRGGDTILLRPCIPAAWPGFTIRYRPPGDETDTSYEIRVGRAGVERGGRTVARGESGEDVEVSGGSVRIRIARDGASHRIVVELGDDAGRRYEERRAV